MAECVLCKKEADGLDHEIEHLVIEMIKKSNPEWIEKDGACQECLDYYKNFDNMVEIRE
jgi:hypothetical protein